MRRGLLSEPRFARSGGSRPPALSARRLLRRPSPARLRELPRSSAALSNLRSHLEQVLSYLGRKGIADVFLVPNRELVAMKKRFLGKAPKTVDVLAFPEPKSFPHPESGKIFLGEIYLNRGIAGSDPARGRALLRHGLLHLLGYRHRRRRDTIKMQNLERKLAERYDSWFPAHNRPGHRNRGHQSGGRGKPRRQARA